jgi:hypothetical protein
MMEEEDDDGGGGGGEEDGQEDQEEQKEGERLGLTGSALGQGEHARAISETGNYHLNHRRRRRRSADVQCQKRPSTVSKET